MTYSEDAFHVKGGKVRIQQAIQDNVDNIKEALEQYEDALDRSTIQIKHLYIDRVEQNITDFKDTKMFGTVLQACGFGFLKMNVINTLTRVLLNTMLKCLIKKKSRMDR